MEGPNDDDIIPPTPPIEYDYEAFADALYIKLWERNATKLGWIQMSRWSPIIKYYLGLEGKHARRVFAILYRRGFFLDRRLAVGKHPSYLFLQQAIPTNDEEARAAAINYWRWFSAWSKGAHVPEVLTRPPSSPLARPLTETEQ